MGTDPVSILSRKEGRARGKEKGVKFERKVRRGQERQRMLMNSASELCVCARIRVKQESDNNGQLLVIRQALARACDCQRCSLISRKECLQGRELLSAAKKEQA